MRRLLDDATLEASSVDAARRRVSRRGGASVRFPCDYLGADDRAGPNYTGQPAVDSHYRSRRGTR